MIVNPDGEIISIGTIYYDYVDSEILLTPEQAKEIVQKDIEKDNNNKDKYSIKEGKTTLEYITKYQGNIAYKSYKIEVINISDKTLAREYYINVNDGNIVYVAYYK